MGKSFVDHQVDEVDHAAQCMVEVIRAMASLVPGAFTAGVRQADLDVMLGAWHDCHVRMAVTLLAGVLARLEWGPEELDRMARQCLLTRDHWVVFE